MGLKARLIILTLELNLAPWDPGVPRDTKEDTLGSGVGFLTFLVDLGTLFGTRV
jgi:hypothetical protein